MNELLKGTICFKRVTQMWRVENLKCKSEASSMNGFQRLDLLLFELNRISLLVIGVNVCYSLRWRPKNCYWLTAIVAIIIA